MTLAHVRSLLPATAAASDNQPMLLQLICTRAQHVSGCASAVKGSFLVKASH
jgi:hypothetical protein